MSNLGKRLKSYRVNRRFTMEQLSDRAGVSKSMISKIERGDVQPTLDVAMRIAKALGTHIVNILEPNLSRRVILTKAKRQPAILDERSGIERHIISPVVEHIGVLWIRVTAPPRTAMTDLHAQMKPGGQKYLWLRKGNIVVTVDEREFFLNTGDSFSYDAEFPHEVENRSNQIAVYDILLNY